MSFELKGKITVIGEVEDKPNGAKELKYRIDTGEQYNNIVEFQLYKGVDHITHIDNFIKYNKVGDMVNVEFNLKTFNWKPEADDKMFTSLSHWKATKVESNDFRKTLREIINLNRETMAIPDGVLVTEFIYGFTSVLDRHSNFFSELI